MIFKRRLILITAVVALLIILLQSCFLFRRDVNTSYLTIIGSCKQQTTIQIIDESNEGDIPKEVFKARKKMFNQFATSISKHIFTKIDEMNLCNGSWINHPEAQLAFVYRPVVTSSKESRSVSNADYSLTKLYNTRVLNTPWVKMTIDKSSKLVVRGVFFWNERQFLLDRAIVSRGIPISVQPLTPLSSKAFDLFFHDYLRSVLMVPGDHAISGYDDNPYESGHPPSQEAQATARINISKRVPADIVWLLSYNHHSYGSMGQISILGWELTDSFKKWDKQYNELTKRLLDNRFTSTQVDQEYDNILDVKNIININDYRTN
jgi:hypothetical protein